MSHDSGLVRRKKSLLCSSSPGEVLHDISNAYVHENIQNGIISRIICNFCDNYRFFVGKSKLK